MTIKDRKQLWLAFLILLLGATTLTVQADTSSQQPFAPCDGERFSDVCPDDWFYPYVADLAGDNVISGYDDGTFRPGNRVTRGQIMKVVVAAAGFSSPLPQNPTFADVPTSHPLYRWVEIGAAKGVAAGYRCESTGEGCDEMQRPYFRADANVSRGQLAKMLANAFVWRQHIPTTPTFRDVPASSAFYSFVERASTEGAISGYGCGGVGEPCPGLYFRLSSTATRAQASKMIANARRPKPTATPTRTRTRTATHTTTRTSTPSGSIATDTSTSISQPTATSTPGGACQVFPTDNIWNRNIVALPTHVRSNDYVASIGLTANAHADFGAGLWDGGPIGIPFVTVPGSQPKVPIIYNEYGDESDPGPYPVPTNAPIEGGPNSTGDRHVLVVDRDACTLYELYHASPNADGSWNAGSGAKWPLLSNALRPAGWTSADAAGLPIYPGLARYDEVTSGVIRHALRFTAPRTQRAYLWPATHFASSSTDPALPPMGLRMRLKASVNISTYPAEARTIMQALKDYGMLLADNGSPWFISGAPDERWNNDTLRLLHNLHGSDFEAVDESGLMVAPNSGESR